MSDSVWVRSFFSKPLELEIVSLTYNGVRFFFSIYIYVVMTDIFFSVQDIIFPRYILASFSPSKSVCRVLFF